MAFKKVKFRVIVAGSRDFRDYSLLMEKLDGLLSRKEGVYDIVIVSGTARGADQFGERYAKSRGYKVERFPADWDRHGKAAGYIRNEAMAMHSDALVAFWNGKSAGTGHMIDLAKKHNLQIRVVRYE